MRTLTCLMIPLAVIALVGCGGGKADYEIAPVSGVVTLDGDPLANASVVFIPAVDDATGDAGALDLPTAVGTTDKDGRYSLSIPTQGEVNGCPVGKFMVSITRSDGVSDEDTDELPEDDDEFVDEIPARYNEESRLRCTVGPDGTDSANFTLKSGEDEA